MTYICNVVNDALSAYQIKNKKVFTGEITARTHLIIIIIIYLFLCKKQDTLKILKQTNNQTTKYKQTKKDKYRKTERIIDFLKKFFTEDEENGPHLNIRIF